MKIKVALLILVFGFAIDFMGAWMKVTHQAFGDQVLMIAAFMKVIGLLLFVFLLLAHPKVKAFLNYNGTEDTSK